MDYNTAGYDLLYDLPQTKIYYKADERLMVLKWGDYVSFDQLKETCELHVAHALKEPVYYVLSDIRGLKGTWTNYLPYLTNDYSKRLTETGLNKFAFLISGKNPFHKFSAQMNEKDLTNVDRADKIKFFVDEEVAMDWLKE